MKAFPTHVRSIACATFSIVALAFSNQTIAQTWTGAPGVTQTTAEITAHEKKNPNWVPHSKPALIPGPVAAGVPDAAIHHTMTPANGNPKPFAPQTVSPVNYLAASTGDCSGFPPDTMGVAGPTQFVISLNGRIRSFNKATGARDNAINVTTDSFFSSVMTPGSNFSSDPRVRYDRLSHRWFISMIDVPGQSPTKPNRIMLAVSDSETIRTNTVWTFFQFQHDLVGTKPNLDTGGFADYPTLAVDANAVYLGVNVFVNGTNYLNTTLYVVRKSSLLSGGPIVVTAFRGLVNSGTGIFTAHGADNYDPASTEGYVIGVDRTDKTVLQMVRISDPGGTPSLSTNLTIPIDPYARPILVQHLGNANGTNGYLDFVDNRLMAAHYRNGLLWTSHNVGVNNTGGITNVTRDGVQWFAITNIPSGLTPAVSQSGLVYFPTTTNSVGQRCYWMGTIMVSGQGHAAMGFTSAGASDFISPATCGRLVGDPANTMQAPFIYLRAVTQYNPGGDIGGTKGRRWGDYSMTSVDPSDDMTMWTIQEYCSAVNTYGVRVAKLLAPPPAFPTNCTPSVFSQGTNLTVTITGSVGTNLAGYFDPGPGFSNHLAAAFSGNGITVNSLTFVDPLTLTASLTVAMNAQAGARSITVTNPDNQIVTSSNGIVTILPGVINNPPVLSPLPDYTLTVGTTLAFTNVATDPDSPPETLTFSFDQGAPTNATLDSATGAFSWSPDSSQLGTNVTSIIVTDSGMPPLSATQSFTTIVVLTNQPPVLVPVADQLVAVGMTLTLTNSATDPDSPPSTLTYSLPSGSPFNATINPTNGLFVWAPNLSQVGTNSLSVAVSDNGLPPLSATQAFTVTVLPSNNPPVLTAISNQIAYFGYTLFITNVAMDPDVPPQTLTFTMTNAPFGATLNGASGLFVWTPLLSDLGSTNVITETVTDNGLPPLSNSKTFSVVVKSPLLVATAVITNSSVLLTWGSVTGRNYRVQFKSALDDTNWTDLAPDVTATGPTATNTDPTLTTTQRLYRVVQLP